MGCDPIALPVDSVTMRAMRTDSEALQELKHSYLQQAALRHDRWHSQQKELRQQADELLSSFIRELLGGWQSQVEISVCWPSWERQLELLDLDSHMWTATIGLDGFEFPWHSLLRWDSDSESWLLSSDELTDLDSLEAYWDHQRTAVEHLSSPFLDHLRERFDATPDPAVVAEILRSERDTAMALLDRELRDLLGAYHKRMAIEIELYVYGEPEIPHWATASSGGDLGVGKVSLDGFEMSARIYQDNVSFSHGFQTVRDLYHLGAALLAATKENREHPEVKVRPESRPWFRWRRG